MAKLILAGAPTFTAKVNIPVPGEKLVPVEFTFNWFTVDEFQELCKSGLNDEELVLKISRGWDLEDQFSPENVRLLLQKYGASGKAISNKYMLELTGVKLGN